MHRLALVLAWRRAWKDVDAFGPASPAGLGVELEPSPHCSGANHDARRNVRPSRQPHAGIGYLPGHTNQPPAPVEAVILWKLHPGVNGLMACPGNVAGRQGVASSIVVEYAE